MCIVMLENDVSATEGIVLDPISPKQATQAQALPNQIPMQEKWSMSWWIWFDCIPIQGWQARSDCDGNWQARFDCDGNSTTEFCIALSECVHHRRQRSTKSNMIWSLRSRRPYRHRETIVHMQSPAEDPPTGTPQRRKGSSNDGFSAADVQR